jgi:hypothetical protein
MEGKHNMRKRDNSSATMNAMWACLVAVMALLAVSCVSRHCLYGEPDRDRFQKLVRSPRLIDSLQQHVLTQGMPYFVVQNVFRGCDGDTDIPVASIGSRQKLDETEGLFSHFHDPSMGVYLARYATERGDLLVWYGNPTFYQSKVMARDTMYMFEQNGIDTTGILCLLNPFTLRLERKHRANSVSHAEIRHREQNKGTSYWYNLSMVDSNVIALNPQKKSEYPIYRLELNNEEIPSFNWSQHENQR